MIWFKKKQADLEDLALAELCQLEAEALYRSGKMHCAEAVVFTIKKHFRPELPDDVVQMVSGFGGGSGSGCVCGAVAAGTVAIGLVLKEDKKRITHLTRELHAWFKEKYDVTCCKIIRSNHKGACPVLTGEVAGKIADMLSRS
ncbi:MAG: C_GCAxxG_C_C family protein [Geobacter sp.]|nr:C_GCAxxG_C_C family protein [Geobacter sp.]